MNISKALLGLLVVAPFTTNAAALIVGGASYHIGTSTYEYQGQVHDLNQVNPAIGIEADGWSAVVVNNSYDKVSVMATKDWKWSIADNWDAGVKVGTATGYKDTPINMDAAPFMQFEVGYTYKAVTTVIGYVPPIQDGMKGVITLHWKIKLH